MVKACPDWFENNSRQADIGIWAEELAEECENEYITKNCPVTNYTFDAPLTAGVLSPSPFASCSTKRLSLPRRMGGGWCRHLATLMQRPPSQLPDRHGSAPGSYRPSSLRR